MRKELNKNSSKIKNYKLGYFAEFISSLFLMFKGYKIIRRRYKEKQGEIDLICRKGDVLVMVEVKARKHKSEAEVVSKNQMKRISKAAAIFVSKNKVSSNMIIRFDLIIFNNILSINHIKNAWQSDEK